MSQASVGLDTQEVMKTAMIRFILLVTMCLLISHIVPIVFFSLGFSSSCFIDVYTVCSKYLMLFSGIYGKLSVDELGPDLLRAETESAEHQEL